MTEKIRYFRIIVKCDEEVIHEEIAKVISSSEQPGNTKINGITNAMLNTLYARDSMAPWSRVLKIRQKINEHPGQLIRIAEEIQDTAAGEKLYEAEQSARDSHVDARIFDDVLRASFNFIW